MQLNIEQRKIIRSKPSGHSLIKGVAGSGKTTVSVYRIPFLLNHYCHLNDDAILMLTFNKTLSNYIKYLYEKIEDEDKVEFLDLFGGNEEKVSIETVDRLIFKYFLKYKIKNKLKLEITTDRNLRYQLITPCLLELKKIYPETNILQQKYAPFLLDEIDWIKSCNYMELEEYQNADRLGRMNKNNPEGGPQRLQKNSNTRKAIFELMLNYNKKLEELGFLDIKDAAIFALREAKERIEKKYSHIIVDESQDLTRVQLEFISCLYQQAEYSSIMFVCDTAQSIYPHSWLVKGRSFTSIGFDMTGKSNSLSKNYRTTTQISKAAYSLIEKDPVIFKDDNFVAPSLIDRQGIYPVYRSFTSPLEEANLVISEINDFLTETYELKDIAVVARNNNQLKAMKDIFDQRGIKSSIVHKDDLNFSEMSVKLLTIHSIKGLEFKAVFIIGLNKDILPLITYQEPEDQQLQVTTDRKLLYVGMTRANELLYMSSNKVPSPFIGDIDPKLLVVSARSQISAFYSMSIDDYYFKEQIINLYSNEEKVRQWFLSELINTYKYPSRLLQIEYPVHSFSQAGAVDIAVCIYKNKGLKSPFIFVEIKAYGKDIKSGLIQLKSYMSNEKTCSYGVVTNGRELIMINNEFELIDDIPPFNAQMLPTSFETFDFIDIKHNRTYTIERDIVSKNEIEIAEGAARSYYAPDQTREILIYGNVAAGLPIYMNREIEDNFFIPQDWYSAHDELFLLKVKGDSMQGVNIEDGDYVLLRKQDYADNRNIVAVSLDEDITLKRFVKMGDTVLLMAENDKYEPIPITSEQARIIGLVYGVIRRRSDG